jgi:hypothetical protein
LAKQTSTPPATRVRTRLSAPFIRSTPVRDVCLGSPKDQSFLTGFVKGFSGHCSYRREWLS